VPDPDSAALRRRARDAQSRFERARLRYAPRTWSGSGSCDEIIGRICMRHGEDDFEPVPDPPELVERREALLRVLTDVGDRIPGDEWVLGQRVWYLLEAGRSEQALRLATECHLPARWPCDGFRGLAHHLQGAYGHAEESFAVALAAMPEEQRERWSDPEGFVEPRTLGWIEDQEDARAALEWIWLLSDPFYLEPGNDRRTEHYARWVVAGMRERARNPYALSWGDDLAEVLVRYGWEVGWERSWGRPGESTAGSAIGHHHPDSRQFVPPREILNDLGSTPPRDWQLETESPRTAYAPLYASDVQALAAQITRLRRDDDGLVVIAMDTIAVDDSVTVDRGAFLVGRTTARLMRADAWDGDGRVFTVRVPADHYAVSVEGLDRDGERGWRAREGLRIDPVPRDVPVLSDLLLLAREGSVPQDLDAALPHTLGTTVLETGQPIRVAWEVYHLGDGPSLGRYDLSIEPADEGLLERAGRWLRLLGDDRPLLLSWEETFLPGPDAKFRAVDLDLPALDAGEFRLRLELKTPGRTPLLTTRVIRLAPPLDVDEKRGSS
jgi:hypothetical protein